MNNNNQNTVSRGKLHVREGVECVAWNANNFSHGIMTLASQNGVVTCEIVNLSV